MLCFQKLIFFSSAYAFFLYDPHSTRCLHWGVLHPQGLLLFGGPRVGAMSSKSAVSMVSALWALYGAYSVVVGEDGEGEPRPLRLLALPPVFSTELGVQHCLLPWLAGLTYLPAAHSILPFPPHTPSTLASFFSLIPKACPRGPGPLHWYFLTLNHCVSSSRPHWLLIRAEGRILASQRPFLTTILSPLCPLAITLCCHSFIAGIM